MGLNLLLKIKKFKFIGIQQLGHGKIMTIAEMMMIIAAYVIELILELGSYVRPVISNRNVMRAIYAIKTFLALTL